MAVTRVAANSDTFTITTPSDRAIVITRLFDAPRHLVIEAMTTPERIVFTEIYAPFPDAGSVITTVLTEERGKTRMTATCLYPSLEVRDIVIRSGMEKGAALSYDRLEEVAQELNSQSAS